MISNLPNSHDPWIQTPLGGFGNLRSIVPVVQHFKKNTDKIIFGQSYNSGDAGFSCSHCGENTDDFHCSNCSQDMNTRGESIGEDFVLSEKSYPVEQKVNGKQCEVTLGEKNVSITGIQSKGNNIVFTYCGYKITANPDLNKSIISITRKGRKSHVPNNFFDDLRQICKTLSINYKAYGLQDLKFFKKR